jgi:ectoine hydroxylase-related dioxygenase (phytanoyl-CoA dioxygenase family)
VSADALPNLDSPYFLTSDQIEQYRTKGWVRLSGVCSAEEIKAYREVIFNTAMAHNREHRPMEERDTYGKAFLQVMNLWTLEETVRPFVLSKRFAGIAAQLLEVDSVRLYHDQALFKEPGGGHTPWHQDQFYWPLNTDKTITMWMPMVDVSEVMGSMTFASGSHHGGFIETKDEISDASEAFFDQLVAAGGFPLETSGAMAAGDATFHSGWTLHRAPGNATDRVREVMTVIFYPSDTTIAEPANEFQRADLAAWLGNLPTGELAASPLNPRLN